MQLKCITPDTPMLTPTRPAKDDPYTGSGEPGAPFFAHLSPRNVAQLQLLAETIGTSGGFTVNPLTEFAGDAPRLARRNIISFGTRPNTYTVSPDQRVEIARFLAS